MRFHRLLACAILLAACSCSSSPETLRVKTFVLRDQERDTGTDPWARMEKESLLRGAVSMEERRQRLGQYFTVLWNDSDTGSGPARVVFQYQQGGSASVIKEKTQSFAPGHTNGRAVFSIIGDEYTTQGRVLAWQARLMRGDREIASRRSYLWK